MTERMILACALAILVASGSCQQPANGDVDFSGVVDRLDGLQIAQASAGLVRLSRDAVARADLDANGTVDILDAHLLLGQLTPGLSRGWIKRAPLIGQLRCHSKDPDQLLRADQILPQQSAAHRSDDSDSELGINTSDLDFLVRPEEIVAWVQGDPQLETGSLRLQGVDSPGTSSISVDSRQREDPLEPAAAIVASNIDLLGHYFVPGMPSVLLLQFDLTGEVLDALPVPRDVSSYAVDSLQRQILARAGEWIHVIDTDPLRVTALFRLPGLDGEPQLGCNGRYLIGATATGVVYADLGGSAIRAETIFLGERPSELVAHPSQPRAAVILVTGEVVRQLDLAEDRVGEPLSSATAEWVHALEYITREDGSVELWALLEVDLHGASVFWLEYLSGDSSSAPPARTRFELSAPATDLTSAGSDLFAVSSDRLARRGNRHDEYLLNHIGQHSAEPTWGVAALDDVQHELTLIPAAGSGTTITAEIESHVQSVLLLPRPALRPRTR